MRARYAVLLCLWVLPPAFAEIAVPAHTAWVTDLSGTLSATETATLEARLTAFAQTKGAQVAVLLVPTTFDEPVEAFALRVAEVWKLGRKGVDDGALLVVATADRRLRIEVGYGLEGVLNDATSKRIIDETIVPHFKSGNLYAGIMAGVERMLAVLDGEALPPPPKPEGSASDALPLAFFFAFFFALLFRGRGRRNPLQVPLAAVASGGLTYLLTTVAFAAGLSAFAAVVIAAMLGSSGGGPGRWVSHRRDSGGLPGGWGGGGFGGGGFGGGGGGSFGGGGASGGW